MLKSVKIARKQFLKLRGEILVKYHATLHKVNLEAKLKKYWIIKYLSF